MKNKILAGIVIILNLSLNAQDVPVNNNEQESKNTEYQQVNGLENWTYDYDISGLKDGKYNLIIRSLDNAGNMSIDGPINIFVDSESDKPTVSISSPSPYMRIGGNLSIVGTASDDDGVSMVEVKIDDSPYIKAQGTLFWSSLLNIDKINDGRHTVTARVIDINGLQGEETSVVINVDRNKPIITIDSHNNGEILSGKKNITGLVTDSNGVSRLEYSLDGLIYRELKLSGKPDHSERKFSLSLDTRDNEGGTSYIRFRTVDGTGSEGSNVFVYFSDNEKPVITIISPLDDEALNGIVTVTGTISDEVGIESFTYSYGDETDVQIPLLPGNPFWTKTFDVRGEKNAQMTFKAVDLSGNVEDYKLKLGLNPDNDKPVISILNYSKDVKLGQDSIIRGIAADDDGIKSIHYIVDSNERQTMSSDGPFVLDFKDLNPGKHTLEISATDITDVTGDAGKFTFIIGTENPQINIKEFTTDKTVDLFYDGIIFQQGKTAKLSGEVQKGEGESSVSFTIENVESKAVKTSKGLFTITIPGKLEIGGHDIVIKATDTIGRDSLFKSRFYISSAPGKDEEYKPVQEDRADLFLIDARMDNDEIVNVSRENPISGYITGDIIRSVELVPSQKNFNITKEGNRFTILPLAESAVTFFSVKVLTDSGQEYISREIKAASDFNQPLLSLDNLKVPVEIETKSISSTITTDENGEDVPVDEIVQSLENTIIESNIINDILLLKGSYSDINSITKAEIVFTGFDESINIVTALEGVLNDGLYQFEQELDLSDLPEGEYFISLQIRDSMNNTTFKTVPFIIDRTAPELSILSPSQEIPVEGIITITGKINNFMGGGKVYFSENGLDFSELTMSSNRDFSHNVDLSTEAVNPENFLYRIVDNGRNIQELRPRFNVDLEADRPKVAIEKPSENSTIRNDFFVTGLVFDDDSVDKILYSMDGEDFQEIDGNFYYNIPFSLANIEDGHHLITVKAQDSGGFMSEEVSTSFLISKAEPVSELIFPRIDDYTKKVIDLKGDTFDENGVKDVYISYDHGISYNRAEIVPSLSSEEIPLSEGTEIKSDEQINPDETILNSDSLQDDKEVVIKTVSWEYKLDTRLPGDGTHSILIKAIDGAGTIGISSTIINIDNTNPEIKLDSPTESDLAAGNLIIDGKVFDATNIKSVISELKALDYPDFPGLIREIDTTGVFRDSLDLTDFKPGWYNLNITVTDFAENSISETRNLQIMPPEAGEVIDLYFPEEGKDISGSFAIEGRIYSDKGNNKVLLKVDDKIFDTSDADDTGLFSFVMETGAISDGLHQISIISDDSESQINSDIRHITYSSSGPWISVQNISSGQFVSGRPMITGTAGFSGYEEDKYKAVDWIEVSLDNGRTFVNAKGKEEWEFRLETYDLPEGENQLLIRAHYKDESTYVTKLYVNIDETAPEVDLFIPEENRKFNEKVSMVGTASDENGLKSVEVLIREGSKERYEVPSFIQGLYIDFHAIGATYGELGIGLSFFDDVVKLQAQVGLAPPGRFTGLVFGVKLLATVVDIPFSYFFGYDWDFFSMSVAVGANFNYYTMSPDGYYFTENGVVLGSVLLQYEFAKFELKNMKVFNSYSFYVEGALWFISSDIQAGVTPTVSFGARIGIF